MEFDEVFSSSRHPFRHGCHPERSRPARSAGRRSEGSRVGAATQRGDPSLRRGRLAAAPGAAQDDNAGARTAVAFTGLIRQSS